MLMLMLMLSARSKGPLDLIGETYNQSERWNVLLSVERQSVKRVDLAWPACAVYSENTELPHVLFTSQSQPLQSGGYVDVRSKGQYGHLWIFVYIQTLFYVYKLNGCDWRDLGKVVWREQGGQTLCRSKENMSLQICLVPRLQTLG